MTLSHSDNLRRFLRQLVAATTNTQLYSIDHPQVQRLLARCQKHLTKLMEGRHEIALFILKDELIENDKPLPGSFYVNRFCQMMSTQGVSHIKLLSGVTAQELNSFVAQLATSGKSEAIRSSAHIQLGKAEIKLGHAGDPQLNGVGVAPEGSEEATRNLEELSGEEMTRFMELYDAVRHHRKFNMAGITEIVTDLVRVFATEANPLMALAPLRAMDEYTFTHSTNVCILNLAQASSLGIQGTALHDIGVAAMLHDIGKLFIPEEILNKPDKLDDDEWAVIKEHPVRGAHYLLGCQGIPQLAVITAYEHHMRYDLKGYPKVKGKWTLNLCSHLTMISDTFDAIRTSRVYQAEHQQEKALAVMAGQAGISLNPILVKNFAHVISQQSPLELDG